MSIRLLQFPFLAAATMTCSLVSSGNLLLGEEPAATESVPMVFDGFDGKSDAEWRTIRPDPTHVSLTRHPGNLTVTTQAGTIGGDARGRQTPLTKNMHLVANPTKDDGDFVVTTCVESFHPTMKYQQAGLVVYDDDDNYLKYDLESDGNATMFKHMREKDTFRLVNTDAVVEPTARLWIRLTKRGNVYERSFSLNGDKFDSAGEAVWGNGRPKWIGIVAENGPPGADEIEARFDFFEVRELTVKERQNAAYLKRQELAGSWTVVATRANGEDLATGPISEFSFDGGNVSFLIGDQRNEVDYTLDIRTDPNGFVMSSLTQDATKPVNGILSLDNDKLVLCLSPPPGTPAPTRLETSEGDGYVLMTLQRARD